MPPSSSEPDAAILEAVQAHWATIQPNSPIYNIFFADIRLVAASNGRIVARLPLAPVHVNSKSTLHGAVSAALVDWSGGMAIASTGRVPTGVSVDIHISYVSAARAGDELEIEAWVSRVGRNLAYTSMEIRKVASGSDEKGSRGSVVATGSHTKYVNL